MRARPIYLKGLGILFLATLIASGTGRRGIMSSSGGSANVQLGIPTNGLEAWYEFDGNANDSIGSYDFSVSGTPDFTTPIATLDGHPKYLYTTSPAFSYGGFVQYEGGCLSAWIKDGTDGKDWFQLGATSTSATPGLSIYQTNSTTLRWYDRNKGNVTVSGSSYDSTAWTHVVVVHKDNDTRIYINGVEELSYNDTVVSGGSSTWNLMHINRSYYGTGSIKIAQFRLYDKDADINNTDFVARLYAEGAPL